MMPDNPGFKYRVMGKYPGGASEPPRLLTVHLTLARERRDALVAQGWEGRGSNAPRSSRWAGYETTNAR